MGKNKDAAAPAAPQDAAQAVAVPSAAEAAEAPQSAPEAVRRYRVAWPSGLHLREAPSMDAAVLAVLPETAEVTAAGEAVPDWLPVETGSGRGWVAAAFLREEG